MRCQPACSLSSSALDELSRVPPPPSTVTRGRASDDEGGYGSSGESAGESSSMEADSICSLDTFPRLNIGRVRPRTASSMAINLGPLRWRLPQAVWRRRRRRRRRHQHRHQQQQLHTTSSGGEYRLPRSLRPSSMFHLRLRYSGVPGSSGNHNKQTHRGSGACGLQGGRLVGGDRAGSVCSCCVDDPADVPAGAAADMAETEPVCGDRGLEPENDGTATAAAAAAAAVGRAPFPFSPSLSSLGIGAEPRHYFCFASHLAQVLSPLTTAPPAPGTERIMPATAAAAIVAAGARRASNSSCRCAQPGGTRAAMTPCLQCYFRSSVVPRRGKFVHTLAGPVLDLASYPASAPLLGSSWPSLSSTSTGPTATTNQSSSGAQQSSGALSVPTDPRTSTDTRGSMDSVMQIRLHTRPRNSVVAVAKGSSDASAVNSHYSANPAAPSRPLTANAETSSSAASITATGRPALDQVRGEQLELPRLRQPLLASPGRRLAAAVSLISSLASELPPDEAAALDSPLRPPSPVSCSASDASFVSLGDPASPSTHSLCSLGGHRTAPASPGRSSLRAPSGSLRRRSKHHYHHPAYLRLVRAASATDGLTQLPSPPAASSAASTSTGSSASLRSADTALPAVPPTPQSETAHRSMLDHERDHCQIDQLLGESNHLLLSGVECAPSHAFVRRPVTAPGNQQAPTPLLGALAAATTPFGQARAGRRSVSNIPPPLALDGLRRPFDVLAKVSTSRPSTPLSDAMSFRTAQSTISLDDRPADEDDDCDDVDDGVDNDDHYLSRHDDCAGCESPVVPPTAIDRHSSYYHHNHHSQRNMMQMMRAAMDPVAATTTAVHAAPEMLSPMDAGPVQVAMSPLSPLSPKSIPLVVQARKARHPVYRFGALANETFEGGRHQDAYDMYSLALQLLDPPPGTTAVELLERPDVQHQLSRLGWATPDLSRRKARSLFTPRQRAKQLDQSPPPPVPQQPSDGARSPDRPLTAGLRSWRPFSSRPFSSRRARESPKTKPQGDRGSVMVIDEPLPAELMQTGSGKFAFSAEMMSQLYRQQEQPGPQGKAAERLGAGDDRDNDDSSSDPAAASWSMDAGDEKADISALLLSNRSAAAYALGKFAAADSDAGRAIALRPGWAKGYFRRGEALLALGRMREAYSFYRKAVALEPQDMHARVSCERARIMAQNSAMGLNVVQLLAGRDFAVRPRGLHPIRTRIFEFAAEMQNYVYVIVDTDTRKCIVLDACWDVDGILAAIEREGLLLAAAAVTHGHFDHVGGVPPPPFASLRIRVTGLAELKRRMPHLPLLVHPLDIPEIMGANPQLKLHQFTPTPNGFGFTLGTRTDIHFMHTPGHTPGSQCLLVNECRLFSGDTLFPGSCGRVDLPGGSLPDMVHSLQDRLRAIPDATIVYPGHEYAGEWTSIAREKKRGFLRPAGDGPAHDQWARLDAAVRGPKHRCAAP